MRLRPCESCHRHVRIGDACPFCGIARAGVLAVAGIAALSISGCDVAAVAHAQDDDSSEDAVRLTPQYGAPDYDPGPPPTPQPLPPSDNRDAGPPRPRH